MRTNFRNALVLCGLTALVPIVANAGTATTSSNKEVKVCNNFSTKPIWVTFSSTPVGGVENRWLTQKILPTACFTQSIGKANWNAGRAYIYDRDVTGTSSENNPDGNFQLVEFTFRDPSGSAGTYGNGVGYNYSAVDSVSGAIPVAVEATDAGENKASSFAYTGNRMTADFDDNTQWLNSEFSTLVQAGWPYFPHSSANGQYKIPGGYNVYALDNNPMIAYLNPAKKLDADALTRRWTNWVYDVEHCNSTDTKCIKFRQSVKAVWEGFMKNAIAHGITPTDKQLAQHITGYVNFGDDNNWIGIDSKPAVVGPLWIALAQGMPDASGDYEQDKYPNYNSRYNLDPYVTAIHKKFKMNVYSFSIDDSQGYFDAPIQTKLVIAVGGLNGLPNKTQAADVPTSPYHSNFGPGWSSVQACGDSNGQSGPVTTLDPSTGSSTPLVFSANVTQCLIQYKSDSGYKAVFTVQKNSNSSLQLMGCDTSAANNVCQGIFINTDTNKDVQGPAAPTTPPPDGKPKGFLALPVGYDSVSSTSCPVTNGTNIQGKGGQYDFTRPDQTSSCSFGFVTSNDHRTVNITVNPNNNQFSCTPACRANPNVLNSNGTLQVFLPVGSAL